MALTDILVNLAYDPAAVCRCLPEFTVDTESGGGYGVNLTESYVRREAGQAPLTAEQTEEIREIPDRNCKLQIDETSVPVSRNAGSLLPSLRPGRTPDSEAR